MASLTLPLTRCRGAMLSCRTRMPERALDTTAFYICGCWRRSQRTVHSSAMPHTLLAPQAYCGPLTCRPGRRQCGCRRAEGLWQRRAEGGPQDTGSAAHRRAAVAADSHHRRRRQRCGQLPGVLQADDRCSAARLRSGGRRMGADVWQGTSTPAFHACAGIIVTRSVPFLVAH